MVVPHLRSVHIGLGRLMCFGKIELVRHSQALVQLKRGDSQLNAIRPSVVIGNASCGLAAGFDEAVPEMIR